MRESPPTISVIIPNYNYGRSIGICIRAAQAQTYPPTEIIVVDDGSTDDSVEIAESLGVRVLRTPANSGAATARNIGAAHAQGSLLFFVDSDVELAPDALEKTVAALQADPEVGAVCGVYEPEPLIPNGRIQEYRCLVAHYWRISSLGLVTFLFSSLCGIPARVFADVGPFNPELKQTEEVDYGHRLSQRYLLVLTDTIRGRHDDDHELLPLLRKLFHRGRLRVPLYARRRRFARGFETASRAYGSLAALLALGTVPLTLFGPLWAVVPATLLATSIGSDVRMYEFVARQRGLGFLLFFLGMHFLTNTAIATGVAAGGLQWLFSRRFRALYDVPRQPGSACADGGSPGTVHDGRSITRLAASPTANTCSETRRDRGSH